MEANLIDEAVGLLNRGEQSEALKCLREYHGIINGFQCHDCKVITSGVRGFRCSYCGGEVSTVVYKEKYK